MKKFVVFANTLILLLALILEFASLYYLITLFPTFSPFTEIDLMVDTMVFTVVLIAVIASTFLMISGAIIQKRFAVPYEGKTFPKMPLIFNVITAVMGLAWAISVAFLMDYYGRGTNEASETMKIFIIFVPRILAAYLEWSYSANKPIDQKTESLSERE